MNAIDAYQRFVGHPFIYEYVRPLLVGGIDLSPAYQALRCDDESVVVDIGCGTGDAMKHLSRYREYIGFDTDPKAVDYARSRYAGEKRARFECRECAAADLREIAPTHVTLIGLLHHLPDDQAVSLLASLQDSPNLVRAVSLDIVFLEGRRFNNAMAWLDRGRFCRRQEGYRALAERAGLVVSNPGLLRCHPTRGLVHYYTQELSSPRRAA
jgi:SAM-dependent methyltransferase